MQAEPGLEALARRWIGALNSGDVAVFDEIVDPDVVDHSGFARVHGRGRDGVKRMIAELRRILPDWQSDIDEIVVEGDEATIRHTGTVTVPHPFRGRGRPDAPPPPQYKLRLQLISKIRVEDGRVVEHWSRPGG